MNVRRSERGGRVVRDPWPSDSGMTNGRKLQVLDASYQEVYVI